MRISLLVLLLGAMLDSGSETEPAKTPAESDGNQAQPQKVVTTDKQVASSVEKTPDAATVKKQMTPAQLALGDPVVNSVGMLLVPIPAGEFQMGSPDSDSDASDREKPQHLVKITKPFYLSVFEVTQQQYEQVMGKNPSRYKGPLSPVEQVSWNDAVEFCRRLSELPEEKAAGHVYRLPTEAEWEYVCRAGTTTEYSFGDSFLQLGEYAWFRTNSGETTHPVGQKKPNPWGLYDMHGNVLEWCQDKWATGLFPGGPGGGRPERVLRGGSFINDAAVLRSTNRFSSYVSANRFYRSGFRVARTYR